MNQKSKFSAFPYQENLLIHQGLLAMIASNSGYGFHNCDQGHPAYRIGAEGKWNYDTWGDSPDHNRLYKMMIELSEILNEGSLDGTLEESRLIFTWQDFCELAVAAYDNKKQPNSDIAL